MYHLNEEMHPENDTCYTCLCTENFDNSTSIPENSDCETIQCLPQLKHFTHLRQGCAPIFHEKDCCAIGYKCRRFIAIKSPAI